MSERDEIAQKVIRGHFATVGDDEFVHRLERASERGTGGQLLTGEPDPHEQLALLPTVRKRLPLDAYLACSLTGLSDDERQLIFHISDSVAEVCREQEINLYEPRKKTDPVHHPDVEDAEVFHIDRDRVLASDLLIHLTHRPSTGAGEELAFAHGALLPIILISHAHTRVSRMITGIPAIKVDIRYQEPEELREELRRCLQQIRPLLEQRKLTVATYDKNVIGEKIRLLREELGLTREAVASAAKMTVSDLTHIEESTDLTSNPEVLKLRLLATALHTTVSDLVEPDLSEQVLSAVFDWLDDRSAARFPDISGRDKRRLTVRLLREVADQVERGRE